MRMNRGTVNMKAPITNVHISLSLMVSRIGCRGCRKLDRTGKSRAESMVSLMNATITFSLSADFALASSFAAFSSLILAWQKYQNLSLSRRRQRKMILIPFQNQKRGNSHIDFVEALRIRRNCKLETDTDTISLFSIEMGESDRRYHSKDC